MTEIDPVPEAVRERVRTATRTLVQPGESRLKRWFLFDGDRTAVSAALLLGVLGTLLVLGIVWPIEYRDLLTETTMVQTVFNTILSGVILLVSIVVSVAGVVISQELTSLGEQTERVDTAIEYRAEMERRENIAASPAQSGRFLASVLRSIRGRADDLDGMTTGRDESELDAEITRLTDDIRTNATELLDTLGRVEAGATDELLVGLDYDCSWQLHQTRRLLAEHDERLTDDDRRTLEDLEGTLRYFLIGREYFKSLYYKREFSDLSTTLLLVALPVIVFITYVLLALDAGRFPELTVLGLSPLTVYISLGYTIALSPYVVLTAYVFRAATVTKRTMAAGPFVLDPDDERSRERR